MHTPRLIPLVSAALFVLLLGYAEAQDAGSEYVAKMYSAEGAVDQRKGGQGAWAPATATSQIGAGDALRTGDGSRAAYLNAEGILVRLSANAFVEFAGADGSVSVGAGDAHFLSRDPHEVPSVTTSIVSGSVRGTEFTVSVRPEKVTFSVLSGQVDLANQFGKVTLASGEEGVTKKGEAPVKRIMVRPFDAVQWALRYPALVSLQDLRAPLTEKDGSFAPFLDALQRGDLAVAKTNMPRSGEAAALASALYQYKTSGIAPALSALEPLKKGGRSDLGDALRASLYLEAGQIDDARSIQESLSTRTLHPDLKALLLAQQSTVSIVRNEVTAAEKQTQEALTLNPRSVQALYAKSLVQQAQGGIQEARATIEGAAEIDSYSSYLPARAAELEFGSGDTQRAETLAALSMEKNSLDPDAQTVQGFILLARGDIDEARSVFSSALSSRSPPPSAHLGLGITEMRDGNREAGRIEIQKAVHLEPTNSLYRSYLAKALFESDRYETSDEELENAKRLDPNDPTPYLYEAFNKLATFRPVEALSAVEDSIERNDNRFVFRSKLLLDQDRATRAVGLGRVFSALDFFNPVRISALRALAEDPSNYSAHLLLKDALTGDPSADTAVVVQDTTAALLAPSTFSSILATASSGASLNNYTTLFEQTQSRSIVDFIGQSKERGLDTSVAHFLGGQNHSFLARYGASFRQGYRDGDYTRNHTGRVVAAYDITSDDKILVDGIVSALDRGDTLLGFDPLTNDPDLDISADEVLARVGYRHSFTTASHFLAQVGYVDLNQTIGDDDVGRPLDISVTQGNDLLQQATLSLPFNNRDKFGTHGFIGDMQQIWNSEYLSLVSGVGFLSLDQSQSNIGRIQSNDVGIPTDFTLNSRADTSPTAVRGYSYLTVKPTSWLRLTGGSNYTAMDQAVNGSAPLVDDDLRTTRWNPRVGVLLYPSDTVTLRGAYFQRLSGASVRDIDNLEPGQVGGIRTIFTDNPGVLSENVGFGLDWKAPKSTYTGVEFLSRRFSEPLLSTLDTAQFDNSTGSVTTGIDSAATQLYSSEHLVTSYLQQVFTDRLVGSLEHTWSYRDDDGSDVGVKSNKTRLGLNYFHPSGFYSFGSGTYRHQLRDNFLGPDTQGVSAFWIFSAGVGYQLPNRHGTIQLAARNIFDETFNFEQPTSDLQILPGADLQLAVNLNF